MGSDSDLKTLKPAIDILREFGIKTEVCILSDFTTLNTQPINYGT